MIDYGSTVGEKSTDYKISGGLSPAKNKYSGIQYNQKEVNAYSCTIHGSLGAVSDLTGYVFSLEERKEIWAEAVKLGARPDYGWSASEAVDLVRRWWNARMPDKLISARVDRKSTQFWNVIDLGYSLVVNYRGNSAYQKDKSDGRLDGTNFGIPTFGHIVRVTKGDKEDLLIVDNYKGSKSNTYEIDNDNWDDLAMYGASAYYFAFASPEIKVASWAEESKQKAEKKGIITDWSNPQDIVGTERLEFIFEKLHLLDPAAHQGGISLERMAVILNRLNLL